MRRHALLLLPVLALPVPLLAAEPEAKIVTAAPASAAVTAVLALAQERARLAREAGLTALADAEAADLAAAPALDATPVRDAPHLVLFRPVTVTQGNPHLDALVAKARARLAKPDVPWVRATPTASAFNVPSTTSKLGTELGGDYGVRANGTRLREDLWLYANPASPLAGDPELLTRLLRRAHAFVDAYLLNELPETTAKPELYDQFAAEQALYGLREFRVAFPGLLTPGQQAAWDRGLRLAADRLWGMMAKANAWNLNIETARFVGVLNLAYLFDQPERVAKVMSHIDKVLARVRPDGGWPYNGESNPSVNYHDELLYSLLRLYDLTGYEPIAKALAAAQWKGPVMGRTDEFWTSPFHKTYRWNYQRGVECGPEAVVALSGNGYARALLDSNREYGNRDDVAWYRADVKPLALPDRITYPDRNVSGPRAWYGRFTYAGTLRQGPAKEHGHETLLGAMTVDEDGRLNSILTDVTPRIRVRAEDVPGAKGGVEETAWAKLTTNLRGGFVAGRSWSFSAAVHGLTTVSKGAYKGSTCDWTCRQLWLGLPDRLIGVLSTVPGKEDAQALEVTTVLRLISGGSTGAKETKKLVVVGPDHWRYGELDIIQHATTATERREGEIPYRTPKLPATEITYAAGPVADQARTWPADTDLTVLVEIRPVWATGEATLSVTRGSDLLALDATVGAATWHGRFNAGTAPVEAAFPTAPGTSLRRFGGDLAPQVPSPATLSLAPGEGAVAVTSPEAQDHAPGWASFQDLLAAPAR